MQIGEVDIAAITFDPRSRDDIRKILRGRFLILPEGRLPNLVSRVLGLVARRIGGHSPP
jgi:hypothetical protein